METAARLSESLVPGDLDTTLSHVTTAAVELIPEVQCASITLRFGDDHLETTAATHDFLLEVDERQYDLREGPCYDAATDTLHVVSSDLAEDPRFPHFGPMAARAGIRSMAAFRLFDAKSSTGALNLYAEEPGCFDDLHTTAALFRHQAAVAIAYAHEVTNLQEALLTRKTIGQAIGIVMERYQLTDQRAFAFLTRLSQDRNVKLRLIAEELIAATEERGAQPSAAPPQEKDSA